MTEAAPFHSWFVWQDYVDVAQYIRVWANDNDDASLFETAVDKCKAPEQREEQTRRAMAWGRNCTFGSLAWGSGTTWRGMRLSKFSRESCLQCIRILSSAYIDKVCTFFVHQIYKGQWLCLDRKLGLWKVDGQKKIHQTCANHPTTTTITVIH